MQRQLNQPITDKNVIAELSEFKQLIHIRRQLSFVQRIENKISKMDFTNFSLALVKLQLLLHKIFDNPPLHHQYGHLPLALT